jgi:competence protein ComEC
MAKKNGLRFFTGLVFVLALLTGHFWSSSLPGVTTMSFLPVGQGDAVFLRTSDDIRVLIDGGPGENILQQLPKALPLLAGDRLDVVILTHPDADHLEGLIPVLERYKVQKVITSGDEKETAAFQEFKRRFQGRTQVIARSGDRIRLSDGSHFYFIWPRGLGSAKTNELSLVAQFKHGEQEVLLTGDIGEVTEKELLTIIKDEYLEAEVLKVPHHGSKHSSSTEFLRRVKPKVAVITVGENRYGHPTKEAIDRVEAVGAEVVRTDLDGLIEVKFGGEELLVVTEK